MSTIADTGTLPAFGLVQIEQKPVSSSPTRRSEQIKGDTSDMVGCLGHNDHERLDDLRAGALRQLAADAAAAAEWLERHTS